jgi:acetyltransferase-like isoleucine patch superfamily enzyme
MLNRRIVEWIRPCRVKLFKKIQEYLLESQAYYFPKQLKSCGKNCNFYYPFHIELPSELSVGSGVSIGTYVHMWCHGGISIGDRVLIGSHAAITSVTHDYERADLPPTNKPVVIEDDVWIGTHAVIMPGVTIGKGAIVGANSVVTRDVEPYAIVIGSPARHYKYRNIEEIDPDYYAKMSSKICRRKIVS